MVRIARGTVAALALLIAGNVLSAPEGATDPRQRIATVLTEVQRGTVNGREFLTLHIAGDAVGPPACRGTALTVDIVQLGKPPRRERIEKTMLVAMLGERPVVITVPLSADDCIDGKPTFTDLQTVLATP